jgi:hypothetical protein
MMNINLNNLDNLVMRETMTAIREALAAHLDGDDDEKRRQERMAKAVLDRDLNVESDKGETNEAEDDADKEEPENLETGVPTTTDKDKEEKSVSREDRTGGKGTKDSSKLLTPSLEKIKNPTVGSVIDKLNALRGGRSLKDPQVKKSFSQYFDNLTSSEKGSLLIFLTGISQILAGVATGTEAPDPGDIGLQVQDIKTSKDNKTSQSAIGKEKSALSGTETAPIVVGERQQKLDVRKILEAYKRYQ